MLQDDVLRIAREAGLIYGSEFLLPYPNQISAIERFANAIASESFEMAATICDQKNIDEMKLAANSLADAIRKLKQT